MAKVYQWQFKIRSYEVNEDNVVHPTTFQNLLEETAINASGWCGYDRLWYAENEVAWVIRRMTVKYLEPVRYADEIQANSWVSDFRRIRSNREYELVRLSDDKPVLRGQADWVFVDTASKKFKKIYPEFEDAFQPDPDTLMDADISLDDATPIENPHQFVMQRPIYRSETDELHHVNNAQYMRWVDDALYHALAEVGVPDAPLIIKAQEMLYKQEATFGDEIEIRGWLDNYSGNMLSWRFDTYRATTKDLINQDTLVIEDVSGDILAAVLKQNNE